MSGMCHGIEAAGTVIRFGQQQRDVRVGAGGEKAKEKSYAHRRAICALSKTREVDEEGEFIHELLGRRDGGESQAAKTKTISAITNSTISAGFPIISVVP